MTAVPGLQGRDNVLQGGFTSTGGVTSTGGRFHYCLAWSVPRRAISNQASIY
jgi:hypothetical protein